MDERGRQDFAEFVAARMTLTKVESARVTQPGRASTRSPSPSPRPTRARSRRSPVSWPAARPRDQLAIIIGGRVVAHPVVASAVHGQVQISGLAPRAQAEALLQSLRSG